MKEIEIQEKKFFINKFAPSVGRRIAIGYSIGMLNKAHSYVKNEACMLELMAHVGVPVEGKIIWLGSMDLIDAHVPDWWSLVQLEFETIKHNSSFLADSDLLGIVKANLKMVLRDMLMEHLESSKSESPTANNSALVR